LKSLVQYRAAAPPYFSRALGMVHAAADIVSLLTLAAATTFPTATTVPPHTGQNVEQDCECDLVWQI